MKFVFSFWSYPFFKSYGNVWNDEKTMWLSWILSVNCIKKFYDNIELVTDNYGKEILIDKLKLPFSSVKLDLEQYNNVNNFQFWAFGKIIAYSLQKEPFVHLDFDAYLWDILPKNIVNAPICVQSFEEFNSPYNSEYPIEKFSEICEDEKISSIIASQEGWPKAAYNCGLFGGNNLDIIKEYTDLVKNFVQEYPNSPILKTELMANQFTVILEQYLIASICKKKNIQVERIIVNQMQEMFSHYYVVGNHEYPYSHMFAKMKNQLHVKNEIETQTKLRYPSFYERVCSLVE